MSGLRAWLERHRLDEKLQVLEENDVDVDLLAQLTEEDLREMGFSIGQRRRFFAALRDEPPGNSDRAAAADPAAEIAERRQMTVVFCDLAGSTELASRHDPETTSALLQSYATAVSGAIVAHRGHVAKFLGDGVLAYFGWPRADEDAAANAVRAALDAVARVAMIEGPDGPLAARVGIATGPVVVSELRGEGATERGAIAGPTPNMAARLEGCARSGEVVINALTRRLLGALFELEDRGEVALKGFGDPVPIWRVIAPARDAMRFEARSGGALTSFVGRESETGLLLERWSRATAGDGQAALLSGEAGIGKSRILRELRREIVRDGAVELVQLQCAPDEMDRAFGPFGRELAKSAGVLPGQPEETSLQRFRAHLDEVMPDPELAGGLFSSLVGLPEACFPAVQMAPQRRQLATITHLAERIRGFAATRPVLVIVEDIHWADPSSQSTLDVLVSRIEGVPVFVVATTRPSTLPDWVTNGNATFCSLNRLSRTAVHAIARAAAGGMDLPEDVLREIHTRTDGVPLFVEELTKAILEAGLLRAAEGRYVLDGPLPPLEIPTTLQDSLMARIDRMAPVKQILQAASCIGREFTAELLGEVVTSDHALDEALGQLADAELIFRRQRIAGEHFVFKHALIQDAAYGSLLSSQRAAVHRRIAAALERRGSVEPAVLARHHMEAGNAVRAAELFMQAGQTSLGRSALDEAIGAFEKGLEAAEHIEPGRPRERLELDLRVGLGTARMARFGWAHPSVSDALEKAFPLAVSFEDEDALCSVLWGLWVHYQTRTEFPKAWIWLKRLEKCAATAPGSGLEMVNDMSVGCQHFWEAAYDKALFHTDRLARSYDRDRHSRITGLTNHDPLVFSQHWAGSLAEWIAGHPDRSLERMEEALTLARKIGHPFNLVFALTAGATALYYLGRGAELLACNDEADVVAEREALGPFSKHVNIYQWRGAALLQLEDAAEAHRLLKIGNDFWSASGGRICTAMFRGWLVESLVALGRPDEAWRLNEANLGHCRQTGDRYMEPECLRLRAVFMSLRGSPREAIDAAFDDAIRAADAQGARSWKLRTATSLASHLIERGQAKEARAWLEPALRDIESEGTGRDVAEAQRVLSLL